MAGNFFLKNTRGIRRHIRTAMVAGLPLRSGSPHTLPGELIVSLTSYPKRFPTLHLTLRSLLSQDMRPNRIILWIAEADMPALPVAVQKLTGIKIMPCADLHSYKKIVPTLTSWPDAFILIADDDVFYPRAWLRRFVEEYRSPKEILCQHARIIRVGEPYRSWGRVTQPNSADVLPIGMAGVLYPPGSLPPETTNAAQFMMLCPNGDDLWLYWMSTRNGCTHRMIKPAGEFMAWPKSQRCALWRINTGGGQNDRALSALVEAYGTLPQTPAHAELT